VRPFFFAMPHADAIWRIALTGEGCRAVPHCWVRFGALFLQGRAPRRAPLLGAIWRIALTGEGAVAPCPTCALILFVCVRRAVLHCSVRSGALPLRGSAAAPCPTFVYFLFCLRRVPRLATAPCSTLPAPHCGGRPAGAVPHLPRPPKRRAPLLRPPKCCLPPCFTRGQNNAKTPRNAVTQTCSLRHVPPEATEAVCHTSHCRRAPREAIGRRAPRMSPKLILFDVTPSPKRRAPRAPLFLPCPILGTIGRIALTGEGGRAVPHAACPYCRGRLAGAVPHLAWPLDCAWGRRSGALPLIAGKGRPAPCPTWPVPWNARGAGRSGALPLLQGRAGRYRC
jgi:hypothetical protein